MKYVLSILLMLASFITPISCTVKKVQFSQDCAGYLEQAADANTPEIALERLNLALEYIERNNLTYGYTSVLWRTEDENIGFWYNNLKACKSELESCLNGTQLEKSNVLMKLRESLTENSNSSTLLTIPEGISRYPNNFTWGIFGWFSVFAFIAGAVWFGFLLNDRYESYY